MPDKHTRVLLRTENDLLYWSRLCAIEPKPSEGQAYVDLVSLDDPLAHSLRWWFKTMEEADDRTVMLRMGGNPLASEPGVFSIDLNGQHLDARAYKEGLEDVLPQPQLFTALWSFLATYELHVTEADIYAIFSADAR